MSYELNPESLRTVATVVHEQLELARREASVSAFNNHINRLFEEHKSVIDKELMAAAEKGKLEARVDIRTWPHFPESTPAIIAIENYYNEKGFGVERVESSELKTVPKYAGLSLVEQRKYTKLVPSGFLIQHFTIQF